MFSLASLRGHRLQAIDSIERRRMKVGHLLYLSGMPRNVFDTYSRRGHLPFLKLNVDEGVDRFKFVHALGLTVFWQLRKIGMEPSIVGQLIEQQWNKFQKAASADPTTSELVEIGIRRNSLGLIEESYWPDRRADPAHYFIEIKVNLTEYCEVLRETESEVA